MFSGDVFLVPLAVAPITIHGILQHGGRVVYAHNSSVTCAIAPSDIHCSSSSSSRVTVNNQDGKESRRPVLLDAVIPSMDCVRASRTIVLTEQWVSDCIFHGHRVPRRGEQYVAYDPLCFRGMHFTTTQLPQHIKTNVIACLQFMGGSYTKHMTSETQLVVFMRMLPAGRGPQSPPSPSLSHTATATSKLHVAEAKGIACVSPAWVQDCLRYGKQLPFPGSEAAGVVCDSTDSRRRKGRHASHSQQRSLSPLPDQHRAFPCRPSLERLVDTLLGSEAAATQPLHAFEALPVDGRDAGKVLPQHHSGVVEVLSPVCRLAAHDNAMTHADDDSNHSADTLVSQTDAANASPAANGHAEEKCLTPPAAAAPKRGRGRPRKIPRLDPL